MDVVVSVVRSRADWKAFLSVPHRVYRDDPLWVPERRAALARVTDRASCPFFSYGDAAFFVVRRGGEAVGRIAAIRNELHLRHHKDGAGFFGFFECINEPEACRALFEAAETWLRERGLDRMQGPVDLSVLHGPCGVLVDGFERRPTYMTPYNPPYYRDLLAAAGLEPSKDLLAFHADSNLPFPERAVRALALAKERLAMRTRPFDRRHIDRDLRIIQQLHNSAFALGWGHLPLSDADLAFMARGAGRFVDPELVRIAEVAGEPAGYIVMTPDWNEVLRRARGHWSFLTPLIFLLYRKRIGTARVIALAVGPGYRFQGVEAMLCHDAYYAAASRGMREIEMSWVVEDNHLMITAILKGGAKLSRRFRIFQKALHAAVEHGAGGNGAVGKTEVERPVPVTTGTVRV